MYTKITNQASLALVTLSEVKAQLRLTTSYTLDDEYLTSLIDVAGELAQTYTNRLLSKGTVIQAWDMFETPKFIYGGMVESITSMTALSADGEEVVIEDYKFNDVSQTLRVPTTYVACTDFRAEFEAGYASAPTKVKQGILMLIATLYNNREDHLVGQTHDTLPFTSTILLDSVKVPHVS